MPDEETNEQQQQEEPQQQPESWEERWARELESLDAELGEEEQEEAEPQEQAPSVDADEVKRLIEEMRATVKEVKRASQEQREQQLVAAEARKFAELAASDEIMRELIVKMPPDTSSMSRFKESVEALKTVRDTIAEDRRRYEEKIRKEALSKVARIGQPLPEAGPPPGEDPPQLREKLERGDWLGYVADKLEGFGPLSKPFG